MRELLRLVILSVRGTRTVIDEIESLNVRLTDGTLLGIRPGHDKLVAMTDGTELTIQRNGEIEFANVTRGMLTVERNIVKIYTLV